MTRLALNLGGSILQEAGRKGGYNTANPSIALIVGNLVNASLGLVGAVFVILAVYSGYLWMTAGGNEEQIEKAKTTLRRAIIGLAIVLAAYAISVFVIGALFEATK